MRILNWSATLWFIKNKFICPYWGQTLQWLTFFLQINHPEVFIVFFCLFWHVFAHFYVWVLLQDILNTQHVGVVRHWPNLTSNAWENYPGHHWPTIFIFSLLLNFFIMNYFLCPLWEQSTVCLLGVHFGLCFHIDFCKHKVL